MPSTEERLVAISKQIRALQDQAYNTIENEVGGILHDLEARYPRHKFRLVGGMGTWPVFVAPPIFGQSHLDAILDNVDGDRLPAYLHESNERIGQLCRKAFNDFNTMVCDIGASPRKPLMTITVLPKEESPNA